MYIKKQMLVFAAGSLLALTGCGEGSSPTELIDGTNEPETGAALFETAEVNTSNFITLVQQQPIAQVEEGEEVVSSAGSQQPQENSGDSPSSSAAVTAPANVSGSDSAVSEEASPAQNPALASQLASVSEEPEEPSESEAAPVATNSAEETAEEEQSPDNEQVAEVTPDVAVDQSTSISESAATEASTDEEVDVVTAETVTSESADVNASVEQEATTTPTRYITIGKNPGDAQCLVFGDQNIPFGSVTLSDWGNWLRGDPRFFIGREFLAIEDDDKFGKILRQQFVPGSTGTDWVAIGANIQGHRTYRLVQSVFMEEGWDWGGEKFQYQGGKMGFGFGSGTYPTGGKNDPEGFTARFMWRGNRDDDTGRIALYSYAADRTTTFGQDFDIIDMPVGRWVEVAIEVTANSAINQSDGSYRAWVDGELELELYNIGWQLAGEQPLIDQLFYMGFYGGNSRDWSPGHNTYMRFGDVCWAPVVDGYSGIDPDVGITKVNPAERNRFLFDDNSGDLEFNELEDKKQRLLGVIGQQVLQFDLASEVDSLSLSSLLNLSSTSFNNLGQDIESVSDENLPDSPVGYLLDALDSTESATAVAFSEGREESVEDFEITNNVVSKIAEDLSDVAILSLEQNIETRGCSANELTVSCALGNSILADVSVLREQQNVIPVEESRQSVLIADEIWNLSRTLFGIPQ